MAFICLLTINFEKNYYDIYEFTTITSLQFMKFVEWIKTLILLYILVVKTLPVSLGFRKEVRPGLSILSYFDTNIIITEQKKSHQKKKAKKMINLKAINVT